jgi:hypothetical protein
MPKNIMTILTGAVKIWFKETKARQPGTLKDRWRELCVQEARRRNRTA